ncbi:hypothetical protein PF005_g16499 [Phytophthora fragariae]|uniref:MULE transposase domain-containing protein n=1 Tax=Phytophthora fragariae TaxID=53985 RepID=A0A6A3YLH8_9STRA|nr:hypothetical protein PF003_g40257 [Phytophthora fragariae]KAE9099666.1 hypothetical protein PF007_g15793 [Phytophthora fragariae]KAE9137736.1 hypothetical protein PF006_g14116 [Phytophthora fragariae]KAE9197475.1 hypothetical protein PF005_g16499 [Phytophthora fragariae]KAE9220488.1 hypothetical protein PF002_g15877 [Phytophthora fragariae]
MSKSRARNPPNYGSARFSLDVSDLEAARELGLLRDDVAVESTNPTSSTYGLAYQLRENIANSIFSSQKAVHSKCKDFAVRCGFQIFVKQTSVKADNSGNAKFACKALNGMQYFDRTTPAAELTCPFFVNVHGKSGKWKITQANFAHNHLKFVGSAKAPCVEGSIPLPAKPMRNTTQQTSKLTAIVETEMLPAHDGSTASMSGAAIKNFSKSKGADVSATTVSRMKQIIDDKIHGDLVESYQKLKAYFELMAHKNPGSVWRVETTADGSLFGRACFIPNAGIHIAQSCKTMVGFDDVHLKEDMHEQGIYLVATVKDYNNHIVPVGLALVSQEDKDNWIWFLGAFKEAVGWKKVHNIV